MQASKGTTRLALTGTLLVLVCLLNLTGAARIRRQDASSGIPASEVVTEPQEITGRPQVITERPQIKTERAEVKTERPTAPTPRPPTRSTTAPFTCPFSDGLFADPASCRRFYTCTSSETFIRNCPPGLFFDDIKKYCTFKNEAICGPVSYQTSTLSPIDENLVSRKCDPGQCKAPDCFCSSDGTQIPGGLSPDEVPQMVTLTLTGGINHLNYPYFEDLFKANRTNPNGCRITGSFFVSHDYTNYHNVQKLYAMGNEIGVNSISNRKPEEYWTRGTYENWTMEMAGMREILQNFAGVAKEDILGVRGPFTKCGGNEQFDMMNDFGFVYDTTMATPLSRIPSWPFSLEYKIPFKCRAGNCPSYSYPGIWELPMNMLYSEDGEGGSCAFLDQCVFLYADEESIFHWLMENFERHYSTNRAPLGLHLQTNWFLDKERARGLSRFIDALLQKDDVYFVTSSQALQWVVQPTPLSDIAKFESWSCPVERTPACNLPKTCSLPHSGQGIASDIRYMQTCFSCPFVYPWVGNAKGEEDKTEPDVYTPEIQSDAVGSSGAAAA